MENKEKFTLHSLLSTETKNVLRDLLSESVDKQSDMLTIESKYHSKLSKPQMLISLKVLLNENIMLHHNLSAIVSRPLVKSSTLEKIENVLNEHYRLQPRVKDVDSVEYTDNNLAKETKIV